MRRAARIVVVTMVVGACAAPLHEARKVGYPRLGGWETCSTTAEGDALHYACDGWELTVAGVPTTPLSTLVLSTMRDSAKTSTDRIDICDVATPDVRVTVTRIQTPTKRAYEATLVNAQSARCVAVDENHESYCLSAIARVAAQVWASNETRTRSDAGPLLVLPPTCVLVADQQARCGTVGVMWKVLADNDDAKAIAVAAVGLPPTPGVWSCTVAGAAGQCGILREGDHAVVYGDGLARGRRIVALCAWTGAPDSSPPDDCTAIIVPR